ncbi:hypothetical protein [Streptomyces sp. NPDC002588]|uniref:hypothetical protein n=1 Tax=Streptomyces sp. NPDC002588 TaxID=3154419 RepID=UPI003327852C
MVRYEASSSSDADLHGRDTVPAKNLEVPPRALLRHLDILLVRIPATAPDSPAREIRMDTRFDPDAVIESVELVATATKSASDSGTHLNPMDSLPRFPEVFGAGASI